MPGKEMIPLHPRQEQQDAHKKDGPFNDPEEVRSEEMTEIIGKMPHWLVRSGITVIGLLCLLLLAGAYFFKYPDMIPAKVTISAANPPVKLVARNSLPIQQIFVQNEETVRAGQVLCVFSNAARYEDIRAVATCTAQIDTSLELRQAVSFIRLPADLQLGELQSNYTELCQAVQRYHFFLQNNAYDATIGSLAHQVGYSNQLVSEQSGRQALQQKQLAIQQRQFAADSTLLSQKIISRVEYEASQTRMLDQQINSGNDRAALLQHKLQESEYRKSIALNTIQKQGEENELQQKVKDAVQRFHGALAQWEQNYVLKSPAAGKVSFFNVWKAHQFVAAGESIMMVIPPAQEFVVRGSTGMGRYGKVKTGQRVLMKLQAYPYEEYGMLEARLTQRSRIPMDHQYAIEMKLLKGLVTNSGKPIPAAPVLEADAEIITADKSILERLFEKLIGKME